MSSPEFNSAQNRRGQNTGEDQVDATQSTIGLEAELQTLEEVLRYEIEESSLSGDAACQELIALVEQIGLHPAAEADLGRNAPADPDSVLYPQLGQYKLLAKLGRGGMGTVYKALHTKLNKLVALKVLSEARLHDPQAVARFQREMLAVGQLNHPNIVAAHDAGDDNGSHFLVMELVIGVDLSTLLRHRGRLPVGAACALACQVAQGLQHAEDYGIVHRDIKPGNLMLTPNGQIKILDMGLALLDEIKGPGQQTELTSPEQLMGTLDYMAPEQGSNSHRVDIRADIYSLGATLYKMLSGAAPFQNGDYDTPILKMHALANVTPAPLADTCDDVPGALSSVVEQMLSKAADDRPESLQRLIELLTPFADPDQLCEIARQTEDLVEIDIEPPTAETWAHLRSSYTDTAPTQLRPASNATEQRPPARHRAWWLAAFGFVLLAVAAVVLSIRTSRGTVEIAFAEGVDPGEVAVALSQAGEDVEIADASNGWTIRLDDGIYHVELRGGNDELRLAENQIEVRRNERQLITITMKSGPSDGSDSPATAAAMARVNSYQDEAQSWSLTELRPVSSKAAWIGKVRPSKEDAPALAMSPNFEEYCPEYLLVEQSTILHYPIPAGVRSFTTTVLNTRDRHADVSVSVDGKPLATHREVVARRVAFDVPKGAKSLELKTTWTRNGRPRCYWLRPRFHRHRLEKLTTDEAADDELLVAVKPKVEIGKFESHRTASSREELVRCPPLLRPDSRCRTYLYDHAPSQTTYTIPKGAERFRAIGMAEFNSSLQFAVEVDGQRLFTSPRCGITKIDIPLPGDAKELTLQMLAPKGNFDGHSRWCFPRFVQLQKPAQPTKPAGELATFQVDGKPQRLQLSPDGTTLIAAAAAGPVNLHDAATGKQIRTLADDLSAVGQIEYAPNSQTIAISTLRGEVTLESVTKAGQGPVIKSGARSRPALAFSPDSKLLAHASGAAATLWNVADGTRRTALGEELKVTGPLAFSGDGTRLAAVCADKKLRVWNCDNGLQQSVFNANDTYQTLHWPAVGDTLVATTDANVVSWRLERPSTARSTPGTVVSPQGRWMARLDRAAGLVHLECLTAPWHSWLALSAAPIAQLAFAADDTRLAVADEDGDISVWSLPTGRQLSVRLKTSAGLAGLTLSQSGQRLATATENGVVTVWQLPAVQAEVPKEQWLRLVNRHSRMALATHAENRSAGGRMSQEPIDRAATAQQWLLEDAPQGYVRLQNRHTGLYLTFDEAKAGEKVTGRPLDKQADAFLWKLEPIDGNFFRIVNKQTGLCLAIWGSEQSVGQYVVQWPFSPTKADHYWRAERVASGGPSENTTLLDQHKAWLVRELRRLNPTLKPEVRVEDKDGQIDFVYLSHQHERLRDLSPLARFKITRLHMNRTEALTDLSALEGVPLREFCLHGSHVADLSPLRHAPLEILELDDAKNVSDLSVLKQARLKRLHIHGTAVKDLTQLLRHPLEVLRLTIESDEDRDLLRKIPTLKTINGMPAQVILGAATPPKSSAAPVVLPDTLPAQPVVYLPFDKETIFQEGGATYARDQSGNQLHAQLAGFHTLVDAARGQGIRFSGRGYGQIANDPRLQGGDQLMLTVAYWFHRESGGAVRKFNSPNHKDWSLKAAPDKLEFYGEKDNNDQVIAAEIPRITADWNHVALAIDGKRRVLRFYLNGKLLAEKILPPKPSSGTTAPICLGISQVWPNQFKDPEPCQLDELVIYDRPLNNDEILALFQLGTSPTPKPE